jgi:hypothetical protein
LCHSVGAPERSEHGLGDHVFGGIRAQAAGRVAVQRWSMPVVDQCEQLTLFV